MATQGSEEEPAAGEERQLTALQGQIDDILRRRERFDDVAPHRAPGLEQPAPTTEALS